MKKQTAMNIIKFLDTVSVKGHKVREAMNDACTELLDIVNAEEPKEPDAKTDTD